MEPKTLSRMSGILLHPTSLPSPYGIGDLGNSAYDFIDFLEKSGQQLWQILPLTHTGFGDSPYQSFSAFAGQPYLISPDHLLELELLEKEDFEDLPEFKDETCEYGKVIPWKTALLKKAHKKFFDTKPEELMKSYSEFCVNNQYWLEDYALFMTLKDMHKGCSWLEWEEQYRRPDQNTKNSVKWEHCFEFDFYCFIQFIFFMEWHKLKKYANEKGVKIIGDIPIFVSMDSADIWANQHLFQVDSKGYPTRVAGVPPDYFSATGQLWGNPLYNWEAHKNDGFKWWISRIESQLKNLDILRIDHFRGFEAYWSIPYGEETAINGEWIKAPGKELFTAVENALGKNLPIIAEDLGIITPEVEDLRDSFGFPGMKVLQFAFESLEENNFLPHRFEHPNCVCYTGTHDNDTTTGWFETLNVKCKGKAFRYMNFLGDPYVAPAFIRCCLASIAAYAIFPLQDVLSVGKEGRMNFPGVAAGNWSWRFKEEDLTDKIAKDLHYMTKLYGRCR